MSNQYPNMFPGTQNAQQQQQQQRMLEQMMGNMGGYNTNQQMYPYNTSATAIQSQNALPGMFQQQGVMGSYQGMVGQTQGIMGQTQGMIGQTQGMIGQTQGMVGQTQGMVGQTQGMVGQTQGMVGQTRGAMAQTQGMIGQTHGITAQSQGVNKGQSIRNDVSNWLQSSSSTNRTTAASVSESAQLRSILKKSGSTSSAQSQLQSSISNTIADVTAQVKSILKKSTPASSNITSRNVTPVSKSSSYTPTSISHYQPTSIGQASSSLSSISKHYSDSSKSDEVKSKNDARSSNTHVSTVPSAHFKHGSANQTASNTITQKSGTNQMYRSQSTNQTTVISGSSQSAGRTDVSTGKSIPTLVSGINRKRKVEDPVTLDTKKIKSSSDQTRMKEDEDEDPEYVQAQIFIGNIDAHTSKEMILEILRHYNFPSPNVWIGRHAKTKEICAFVKLPSLKDSKRVIAEMKGFPYKGREMDIRFSAAADFIDYNVSDKDKALFSATKKSATLTSQQVPDIPIQTATLVPVDSMMTPMHVGGDYPEYHTVMVPVPVYPAVTPYGTHIQPDLVYTDVRYTDNLSDTHQNWQASPVSSQSFHEGDPYLHDNQSLGSHGYDSRRKYSRSPDRGRPYHSSDRLSPNRDRRLRSSRSRDRKSSFSPLRRRRSSNSPPRHRRSSISPARGRRSSISPARGRRSSISPSRGRRSSISPSRGRRSSNSPSRGRRSSISPSRGRRSKISPSRGQKSRWGDTRDGPSNRSVHSTEDLRTWIDTDIVPPPSSYCVFINNLPPDLEDADLERLVNPYPYDGVRLKVQDGLAEASVNFNSRAEAELMAQDINQKMFLGVCLNVTIFDETTSGTLLGDRASGSLLDDRAGTLSITVRGDSASTRGDGKKKSLFQSYVDASYASAPVLGRRFIKEYMSKDLTTAHYLCIICEKACTWRDIADHVMGYRHRLKSLRQSHRKMYDRICLIQDKGEMIKQCTRYASELFDNDERIVTMIVPHPEQASLDELRNIQGRTWSERSTSSDKEKASSTTDTKQSDDSTSDILKRIAAYKKKFEACQDTTEDTEADTIPAKRRRGNTDTRTLKFDDLKKQNKSLADSIVAEIASARQDTGSPRSDDKSDNKSNNKSNKSFNTSERKPPDNVGRRRSNQGRQTAVNRGQSHYVPNESKARAEMIMKRRELAKREAAALSSKEPASFGALKSVITPVTNVKDNKNQAVTNLTDNKKQPVTNVTNIKNTNKPVVIDSKQSQNKTAVQGSVAETSGGQSAISTIIHGRVTSTSGIKSTGISTTEQSSVTGTSVSQSAGTLTSVPGSVAGSVASQSAGISTTAPGSVPQTSVSQTAGISTTAQSSVPQTQTSVSQTAGTSKTAQGSVPQTSVSETAGMSKTAQGSVTGTSAGISAEQLEEGLADMVEEPQPEFTLTNPSSHPRSKFHQYLRQSYKADPEHFMLIGLEYTIEISPKAIINEEFKYHCSLCGIQCDGKSFILHLGGFKHRCKYMQLHNRDMYLVKKNTPVDEYKQWVNSESLRLTKKVQENKKLQEFITMTHWEFKLKKLKGKKGKVDIDMGVPYAAKMKEIAELEKVEEKVNTESTKGERDTSLRSRIMVARQNAKPISMIDGRETVQLYQHMRSKPGVPLLGLNRVIEIQGLFGRKSKNASYVCTLCNPMNKIDGVAAMYEHLIGNKHMENYLNTNYPQKMIHLKLIYQSSAKNAYLLNQAKLVSQNLSGSDEQIYMVNLNTMEEEKKAAELQKKAKEAEEAARIKAQIEVARQQKEAQAEAASDYRRAIAAAAERRENTRAAAAAAVQAANAKATTSGIGSYSVARVTDLSDTTKRAGITAPVTAHIYSIIAGLENTAVVGLSYITEIHGIPEDRGSPRYLCSLCHNDIITVKDIKSHLIGNNHMLNFLKVNYPVFYSTASGSYEAAVKYCQDIEEQFGRESVSVKTRLDSSSPDNVIYSNPVVSKAPVYKSYSTNAARVSQNEAQMKDMEMEVIETNGDLEFYKLLKNDDHKPLLGLQFVREVQHPTKQYPPVYECLTCKLTGPKCLTLLKIRNKQSILAHLCSYVHRMNYFKENHPHIFRELTGLPPKGRTAVLNQRSSEIEWKVGRGVVEKVINDSKNFWMNTVTDPKQPCPKKEYEEFIQTCQLKPNETQVVNVAQQKQNETQEVNVEEEKAKQDLEFYELPAEKRERWPLLGLQFVREVHHPTLKYEPVYECLICKVTDGVVMPKKKVLFHINHHDHKLNFCKEYHPDVYKEISEIPNFGDSVNVLRQRCIEIEIKFGQGLVKKVVSDEAHYWKYSTIRPPLPEKDQTADPTCEEDTKGYQQGLVRCIKCEQVVRITDRRIHILAFHQQLYPCRRCNINFPSHVLLNHHITKMGHESPYRPKKDEKVMTDLENQFTTYIGTLTVEQADEKGRLRLMCSKCHEIFRPADAQGHYIVSHLQPYHCDECDKRYGTTSELAKHLETVHSITKYIKPQNFDDSEMGELFWTVCTLNTGEYVKFKESTKIDNRRINTIKTVPGKPAEPGIEPKVRSNEANIDNTEVNVIASGTARPEVAGNEDKSNVAENEAKDAQKVGVIVTVRSSVSTKVTNTEERKGTSSHAGATVIAVKTGAGMDTGRDSKTDTKALDWDVTNTEDQEQLMKEIKKLYCICCETVLGSIWAALKHYNCTHTYEYLCPQCFTKFPSHAKLRDHCSYRHNLTVRNKLPVVSFSRCFDAILKNDRRTTFDNVLKTVQKKSVVSHKAADNKQRTSESPQKPPTATVTKPTPTPSSSAVSLAKSTASTNILSASASTPAPVTVSKPSPASSFSAAKSIISTSVSSAAASKSASAADSKPTPSLSSSTVTSSSLSTTTARSPSKSVSNTGTKPRSAASSPAESTAKSSTSTRKKTQTDEQAASPEIIVEELLEIKEDPLFDWDSEYDKIVEKMEFGGMISSARKSKFIMNYRSSASFYPVIGIQWITEFQRRNIRVAPWYICELCKDKVTSEGIIGHITSVKHRVNSMRMTHPAAYNHILTSTFTSMESLKIRVEKLSREAMKKEGNTFSIRVMIEVQPASDEGAKTSPVDERITKKTEDGSKKLPPWQKMSTFSNKDSSVVTQPINRKEELWKRVASRFSPLDEPSLAQKKSDDPANLSISEVIDLTLDEDSIDSESVEIVSIEETKPLSLLIQEQKMDTKEQKMGTKDKVMDAKKKVMETMKSVVDTDGKLGVTNPAKKDVITVPVVTQDKPSVSNSEPVNECFMEFDEDESDGEFEITDEVGDPDFMVIDIVPQSPESPENEVNLTCSIEIDVDKEADNNTSQNISDQSPEQTQTELLHEVSKNDLNVEIALDSADDVVKTPGEKSKVMNLDKAEKGDSKASATSKSENAVPFCQSPSKSPSITVEESSLTNLNMPENVTSASDEVQLVQIQHDSKINDNNATIAEETDKVVTEKKKITEEMHAGKDINSEIHVELTTESKTEASGNDSGSKKDKDNNVNAEQATINEEKVTKDLLKQVSEAKNQTNTSLESESCLENISSPEETELPGNGSTSPVISAPEETELPDNGSRLSTSPVSSAPEEAELPDNGLRLSTSSVSSCDLEFALDEEFVTIDEHCEPDPELTDTVIESTTDDTVVGDAISDAMEDALEESIVDETVVDTVGDSVEDAFDETIVDETIDDDTVGDPIDDGDIGSSVEVVLKTNQNVAVKTCENVTDPEQFDNNESSMIIDYGSDDDTDIEEIFLSNDFIDVDDEIVDDGELTNDSKQDIGKVGEGSDKELIDDFVKVSDEAVKCNEDVGHSNVSDNVAKPNITAEPDMLTSSEEVKKLLSITDLKTSEENIVKLTSGKDLNKDISSEDVHNQTTDKDVNKKTAVEDGLKQTSDEVVDYQTSDKDVDKPNLVKEAGEQTLNADVVEHDVTEDCDQTYVPEDGDDDEFMDFDNFVTVDELETEGVEESREKQDIQDVTIDKTKSSPSSDNTSGRTETRSSKDKSEKQKSASRRSRGLRRRVKSKNKQLLSGAVAKLKPEDKPFPNKFPSSMSLGDFLETFKNIGLNIVKEDVTVNVAGRIDSCRRVNGNKLLFYDLRADCFKIQVMASAKYYGGSEAEFVSMFEKVSSGDILHVWGHPGRTTTGALSIIPTKIEWLHHLPSLHVGGKDKGGSESEYSKSSSKDRSDRGVQKNVTLSKATITPDKDDQAVPSYSIKLQGRSPVSYLGVSINRGHTSQHSNNKKDTVTSGSEAESVSSVTRRASPRSSRSHDSPSTSHRHTESHRPRRHGDRIRVSNRHLDNDGRTIKRKTRECNVSIEIE